MTHFVIAFFEGAHDANFVGRILLESKSFEDKEVKVAELPKPVDRFVVELYKLGNVEGQAIGKAEKKMPPAVALRSSDGERVFLGFVTNGVNNTAFAHEIIKRLMAFARPDEIGALNSNGHKYSLMFFFDADDHGTIQTEQNFASDYGDVLKSYDTNFCCPTNGNVTTCAGVPVGLYVFCDGTGSGTGTLEDCVTCLIGEKHKASMEKAMSYLEEHHLDLPFEPQINVVASRAKRFKAGLTILGQREKRIAGSSLAVILRDSTTLSGAFDFTKNPALQRIKDLTEKLYS